MQWFRYYHEALDDPKVQRCSGDAFRCWVNLLSLKCRCEGELPPLNDIAFSLRLEPNKLLELLSELGDLVVIDDDTLSITNWDKRQYRSDNSTERSRKHRKTKAQRECNVAVTPPETETETETETDINLPSEDSPISEAAEIYKSIASEFELPAPRLTDKTKTHLRKTLKAYGLEAWREGCDKIRGSPFLRGENDRGWRVTLGWLAEKSKFEKVIEGRYDDTGSNRSKGEQPHNPGLAASRDGMVAARRARGEYP